MFHSQIISASSIFIHVFIRIISHLREYPYFIGFFHSCQKCLRFSDKEIHHFDVFLLSIFSPRFVRGFHFAFLLMLMSFLWYSNPYQPKPFINSYLLMHNKIFLIQRSNIRIFLPQRHPQTHKSINKFLKFLRITFDLQYKTLIWSYIQFFKGHLFPSTISL